jgi:Tol biopolymer transport system component
VWSLYTIDPDGTNEVEVAEASWRYAWSPDGSWIAWLGYDDGQLYLTDPDGAIQLQLTSAAGEHSRPAWRPEP